MISISRILAVFSVVCLTFLSGCGGDSFTLVPVTGIITLDGTPLSGAQVNFFPLQTDQAIVGPYSSAITDDQGKFTMVDRYGNPGAVVGEHRVTVKYAGVDLEELSVVEDELRELIEDAKEADGEEAKELATEIEEAKQELAQMKKNLFGQNNRPIPAKYAVESQLRFNVPAGGSDAANVDLLSK